MSRSRKLITSRMTVIATLLFSASVLASDKDPANCIELIEAPDLYNNCRERTHHIISGSIPNKVPEEKSEEDCYCDVRKRRQVENRMKNIERERVLSVGGAGTKSSRPW